MAEAASRGDEHSQRAEPKASVTPADGSVRARGNRVRNQAPQERARRGQAESPSPNPRQHGHTGKCSRQQNAELRTRLLCPARAGVSPDRALHPGRELSHRHHLASAWTRSECACAREREAWARSEDTRTSGEGQCRVPSVAGGGGRTQWARELVPQVNSGADGTTSSGRRSH